MKSNIQGSMPLMKKTTKALSGGIICWKSTVRRKMDFNKNGVNITIGVTVDCNKSLTLVSDP